MVPPELILIKHDAFGQEVIRYPGTPVYSDERAVVVRCRWTSDQSVDLGGLTIGSVMARSESSALVEGIRRACEHVLSWTATPVGGARHLHPAGPGPAAVLGRPGPQGGRRCDRQGRRGFRAVAP